MDVKPRVTFYHIYPRPYAASDIFHRLVSLAYRSTSQKIRPRGKVIVDWRVSESRCSIDGSTYRGRRGCNSGYVVMKIPADLKGQWLSDTANNLAIVVGTFAHELSHVQDNQAKRRRVRKPTTDQHGTPSERDADHEEHRCLRTLATYEPHRAKFMRLARRLHKKGLRRP